MKALAVATGIVFWTLVLGTAWLVFFPGSDSGEPVAVLQVEPAAAPSGSQAPESDELGGAEAPDEAGAEAPGEEGNVDLPPGFAVTGPSDPPAGDAPQAPTPDEGAASPPLPQPDDATPPTPEDGDADQQGALPAASQQTAALEPVPVQTETIGAPAATEPAVEQSAALSPSAVQAPSTPAETDGAEETGSIALPPVPVPDLVEQSQYGPLPKVALDGKRPAEVYARPSQHAKAAMGGPARVAVLINGLGLPDAPSPDVLEGLPAPVSVAYVAYGRSLQELVTKARASGHEVLLQIPLEPNNYPTEDPGPHTLLTTLPPDENLKRLQWLMSRYTGYVGVTNYMGAKFETTREAMLPVLEEVKRRGLLYLDDGSVEGSAGEPIAGAIGLDYAVANVRLDEGSGGLAKALAKLETMAREHGTAIGVARAKAITVKQLADWAGKLEGKGLVLIPVSAAMRSQRQS
jgi:polysaccharide deacetylase 2 family uncharacterized protein YibQ